jgi:geranyl-CoA carboxylase alpha subunit
MAGFHHVLIANRGEIAVRILRTARAMGYRTTAVYSAADADAAHVALADQAVPIGEASVTASYLSIERIVEAARRAGADAVHPGYGLLSENAAFARACQAAGLLFIGPCPETIELMGDKRRARLAMQRAGVACVPGYDGEAQDDATLAAEAARIGYPIMVKAAAGGGGRGMRRVPDSSALAEAVARARSEAQKAFGDGRLILERAVDGARHVEVQVLADQHGHVLHLGERDCSVQRRFQKVLEEAPSPAVGAALRARMGETAVLAATSSGYVGAGTVELLLGADGAFYFLEMNTRLQVEHPVTELVTGLDLVEWQLRVARGEPLAFGQSELSLRGHAIEARLYAEDPAHGFVPATGVVCALSLPSGAGVRVDHGLAEGLVVSAHYDPMLAKVIAHGADREEARARLLGALRSLRLLGVRTNQAFLCDTLEHPRFAAGTATTDFLDLEHRAEGRALPEARVLAGAALALVARARAAAGQGEELCLLQTCAELAWPVTLEHEGGERVELRVEPTGDDELIVHVQQARIRARLLRHEPRETTLLIDGVRVRLEHVFDGERVWLHTEAGAVVLTDVTYAPPSASQAQGSGRALAPMDGAIVDVPAQPGAAVVRGQTLVVVEAMKLELRVPADRDGVVAHVHVQRGQQVRARQLLVELEAEAG